MTDTRETWDNVKVVAGRERRTQTYRRGGRWRRTLVEVPGGCRGWRGLMFS